MDNEEKFDKVWRVVIELKQTRDRIKKGERIPGLSKKQEQPFCEAVLGIEMAIEHKDFLWFGAAMFLAATFVGTPRHQRLIAAELTRKALGRALGKMGALTLQDKIQQYHEWDREIRKLMAEQDLGITAAREQLGITSTYYRYAGLAKNS